MSLPKGSLIISDGIGKVTAITPGSNNKILMSDNSHPNGISWNSITDITNQAGLVGQSGDTGFTGTSGPTGATGQTGQMGYIGATGQTGYTGATGQMGYTGATGSYLNFTNIIYVDKNGNDSTGQRNGKPFLTITASLNVALSGDIVIIYPGTYNETISIPSGVNVKGISSVNTIISKSVSSNTDLITLQSNCLLENITLN